MITPGFYRNKHNKYLEDPVQDLYSLVFSKDANGLITLHPVILF